MSKLSARGPCWPMAVRGLRTRGATAAPLRKPRRVMSLMTLLLSVAGLARRGGLRGCCLSPLQRRGGVAGAAHRFGMILLMAGNADSHGGHAGLFKHGRHVLHRAMAVLAFQAGSEVK